MHVGHAERHLTPTTVAPQVLAVQQGQRKNAKFAPVWIGSAIVVLFLFLYNITAAYARAPLALSGSTAESNNNSRSKLGSLTWSFPAVTNEEGDVISDEVLIRWEVPIFRQWRRYPPFPANITVPLYLEANKAKYPPGLGWLEYTALPEADQPDLGNLSDPRDMDELIVGRGYPMEKHIVISGSGYKLGVFRIPHGKTEAEVCGHGAARQPVLLLHGFTLASNSWLINTNPESRLATVLADRGYDVWMFNARAVEYSREHAQFHVKDSKFWAFSFDEIALEDTPSVVDYILNVTKARKVHTVGHSQGGSLVLAALADIPEFNNKIAVHIPLGPVAYARYLRSTTLQWLAFYGNASAVITQLPPQSFFPLDPGLQAIVFRGRCSMLMYLPLCIAGAEQVFGTSHNIRPQDYRRVLMSWPSPVSGWNLFQYGQWYTEQSPGFFKFGFGQPYNLSRITAPVHTVAGTSDVFADFKDVSRQEVQIDKGSAEISRFVSPKSSHLDFVWAPDNDEDFFPYVLDKLHKYTVL